MKADVQIEGPRKRQHGEDQGKRVEDTGLKIAQEGRTTKIVRTPVGNVTVPKKLSEEVLRRIRPPVNVPKKESLVSEEHRIEKEEHQADRYPEREPIFESAQFHIQKDVHFYIIIITKGPGFSPGKSAPKVGSESHV
jgi:hypothetical protein